MRAGATSLRGSAPLSVTAVSLAFALGVTVGFAAPAGAAAPANNTPDVLATVTSYTALCQWPDGAIQFKPEPPGKDVRCFVDHPAGMAENVARCYLYTGDPRALEVMRGALRFLHYAEPRHGQYFGGPSGKETFSGMDAYGCWAQAFSVPVAWLYMLTGDKSVITESHDMIADAYDHHLDQFPFQNSTYNHERLLYWKGLVMARAIMKMAGDDARAARYEKAIRLWREAFDYGWFEPHAMFTQWPFME